MFAIYYKFQDERLRRYITGDSRMPRKRNAKQFVSMDEVNAYLKGMHIKPHLRMYVGVCKL